MINDGDPSISNAVDPMVEIKGGRNETAAQCNTQSGENTWQACAVGTLTASTFP